MTYTLPEVNPAKYEVMKFRLEKRFFRILKIFLAIFFSLYYGYFAFFLYGKFNPLDILFDITHEFGHVLASPLSFAAGLLGGTVAEFSIILGMILFFLFKKNYYGASIATFFLASRLRYTSGYIASANEELGIGFIPYQNPVHDWNWILTQIGQLQNAESIGYIVKIFSYEVTIIAIILSLWFAFKKEKTVKLD